MPLLSFSFMLSFLLLWAWILHNEPGQRKIADVILGQAASYWLQCVFVCGLTDGWPGSLLQKQKTGSGCADLFVQLDTFCLTSLPMWHSKHKLNVKITGQYYWLAWKKYEDVLSKMILFNLIFSMFRSLTPLPIRFIFTFIFQILHLIIIHK